MTTEKEWWWTSYADDIHMHIRQKEKNRYLFRGHSPQLYMRKRMLVFMAKVCQKMEFCTTVHHLAVYLLDIFMDNHVINTKHLEMVAVGCLTVAAKLEEKDRLIPKHSEFAPFLISKYKLSEFMEMEVSILTFFKWDILFPTAAHFTEYYLLFSVRPTDLLNDKPVTCYDEVDVYLRKYIEYFLDITIRDLEYMSLTPSLVAASIIAATRRCMLLKPSWPDILQSVTLYSFPQIQPCVERFMRALDEDMIKEGKKSQRNSQKKQKVSSNSS